jgi:hypothetical protein
MDYIMLYFVGTTVILGFIAAFAYALRLQYKGDRDSESFVLEQSLNASLGDWGPPGVGKTYRAKLSMGCDVCGVWTPGFTCSECATWAEVQTIRRENFNTLKSLLAAPIMINNETEHRRLVKRAGW